MISLQHLSPSNNPFSLHPLRDSYSCTAGDILYLCPRLLLIPSICIHSLCFPIVHKLLAGREGISYLRVLFIKGMFWSHPICICWFINNPVHGNQWMRNSYMTDKNSIYKQPAPNLIFSIKLFPQLHWYIYREENSWHELCSLV